MKTWLLNVTIIVNIDFMRLYEWVDGMRKEPERTHKKLTRKKRNNNNNNRLSLTDKTIKNDESRSFQKVKWKTIT